MKVDKVTAKNFLEDTTLMNRTYNILNDSLYARNKNENYNIFTFYLMYWNYLKSINQCLEDNNKHLEDQYFVYREHNFIEDDTKKRIKELHEEKHHWNIMKDLRFKETERLIRLITPIVVAMVGVVAVVIKIL